MIISGKIVVGKSRTYDIGALFSGTAAIEASGERISAYEIDSLFDLVADMGAEAVKTGLGQADLGTATIRFDVSDPSRVWDGNADLGFYTASFGASWRRNFQPVYEPAFDDWLKKRLTPAKRHTDRWAEFAEAVEQFWETYYDGSVNRLWALRSVFTAADSDLVTIVTELGDRFRDDIGREDDRPIQVIWRRLELQGKEVENLIQMALKRKFFGLDIEWVPLYAHKDADYGTDLKAWDEILLAGADPDDYFLTSRGRVRLASATMGEYHGLTYAELMAAVDEEIERLLPTHIVYEGTEVITIDTSMLVYFGGRADEGIIEYVGAE